MHESLIRSGRARVRRCAAIGYVSLAGTATMFVLPFVTGIFGALSLIGANWGDTASYWRTVILTALALGCGAALFTAFTSLYAIERLAIRGAGGWPSPQATRTPPPRLDPRIPESVQSIVDVLSLATGTTPPRVAVCVDPAPNCMTVGRKPETAWILVSTGLVETLSRRQLEAVLAFELGRVVEWDVSLDTVVYAMTARMFELWATVFDDVHDESLLMFPLVVLASPFIALGWWLRAHVLRYRARLSDGLALRTTRNPRPLLEALEILNASTLVIRRGDPGAAHLWFEYPHTAWSRRLLRSHRILPGRIQSLRAAIPDVGGL